MKRPVISIIFSIICIISFGQNDLKNSNNSIDTLFRFNEGLYEPGVLCGYKNQNGDTIIPVGKYFYCFTDSIIDFGVVMQKGEKAIAIDQTEKILYEVYWCDNGPDRIQNKRFRIIKNGKIGYADNKGRIIIEPQFMCAFQFINGIAKVSYQCDYGEPDDEGHRIMSSDEWFFIDSIGNKTSSSDIFHSQLQGLITTPILIETVESGKSIRMDDSSFRSINPKDVHLYLNGINSDIESIKGIDMTTIGQINVIRKIHQFQIDIGFQNDSNIMLVSTKKGIQKCDSILSNRFSFYDKFVNSMDLSKVQFTYKGETVRFNELVGYENKIILKEIDNKIVIEIK